MAQNSMSLLRANWVLWRPVLTIWEWICLRVWVLLHLERRARDGCDCRSLYGGSVEGRTWRVDGAIVTVGEESIFLDAQIMEERKFEILLVVSCDRNAR